MVESLFYLLKSALDFLIYFPFISCSRLSFCLEDIAALNTGKSGLPFLKTTGKFWAMIRIITGMYRILLRSWTYPEISKSLSSLLFIDPSIKKARSLFTCGWLHILPSIHIQHSYNYIRFALVLCLPFHSLLLRHMESQSQLQHDTNFFSVPSSQRTGWKIGVAFLFMSYPHDGSTIT